MSRCVYCKKNIFNQPTEVLICEKCFGLARVLCDVLTVFMKDLQTVAQLQHIDRVKN